MRIGWQIPGPAQNFAPPCGITYLSLRRRRVVNHTEIRDVSAVIRRYVAAAVKCDGDIGDSTRTPAINRNDSAPSRERRHDPTTRPDEYPLPVTSSTHRTRACAHDDDDVLPGRRRWAARGCARPVQISNPRTIGLYNNPDGRVSARRGGVRVGETKKLQASREGEGVDG